MIPQNLKDRIQSGQCVLFLGAGATRDAGGPTGPELASILANHFGKPDIPTYDLAQFSATLTGLPDVDREDVDQKIVEVLKRLEPAKGHLAVPILPWRAIFTTNYDRLVEISYDTVHSATGLHAMQELHVAISADEQVSVADRTKVCLFKIHGCISKIDRGNPLVLTQKDLRSTRKKRSKMLRFLKSLAREHALVFIGYSFVDGVVTGLLEELEEESPYHSRRTMYLVSPSLSPTERAFFEAQRFSCITYTFSDFMDEISSYVDDEAKKTVLGRRLTPIVSPKGEVVNLPNRLKVSLDNQVEFLNPDSHPQADARPFLKGLTPTVGDLKNRNDIERNQQSEVLTLLIDAIKKDDYIRPLVVVVGAGGAGKSTLALRCSYELAERGEAVVFRLKSQDLWKKEELVELATRISEPTVFVCDNMEIHARFKALRDLRLSLSAARCRSVLVASCQKAVWNELDRTYPQQGGFVFPLADSLTEGEARDLIQKLANHNVLDIEGRKGLPRYLRRVMDEYEGNLVVSMLELVGDGKFRDIVLSEYEHLSPRAKKAYEVVALIHQHRRSIPDYLLNELTVKDWNVFTDEVIRLESELIIVQDLDFGSGRLCFRTRHPAIARIIVDNVISRHEDRVRMYRQIIGGLGASEEDRSFLLGLLTSRSVRQDIGDDRYIEEFLERALDLFPADRAFILQLGKFENQIGNTDKAFEILKWGRSIEPRDSYIIHQLGVCEERRAIANENLTIREAHFLEAQKLYREKQLRDPQSHYGYSFEARMHLRRAKDEVDEQKRLDLLSAAMDVIRRGQDIVREDDRGVLRECEAEAVFVLGQKSGLAAQLEQLEREGNIRYASSYHLLAVCWNDEGESEKAFEALARGLEVFPGDSRLINLTLELFERDFHRARVRDRIRPLLEGKRIDAGNVRGVFLRAVLLFYDNQFARSRHVFDQIRQMMNRQASTKIRLLLSDAADKPEDRRGAVKTAYKGKIFVVDQQSGERIPLDNRERWAELGQPAGVLFNLGFSLAGTRAVVVRPLLFGGR